MVQQITKERDIAGELFRLTQLDSDISASSDSTCENWAIRYSFAPIWKWQVPVNQEIVLKPEHKFGAHIEDDEASSAVWTDIQFVRIEVWDAALKRCVIVYEGRFIQSKELQDRDKMAHLDIVNPVRLPAGSWIYILGKCPNSSIYTIDVSDSYFSLETTRVRPSLYKD